MIVDTDETINQFEVEAYALLGMAYNVCRGVANGTPNWEHTQAVAKLFLPRCRALIDSVSNAAGASATNWENIE